MCDRFFGSSPEKPILNKVKKSIMQIAKKATTTKNKNKNKKNKKQRKQKKTPEYRKLLMKKKETIRKLQLIT